MHSLNYKQYAYRTSTEEHSNHREQTYLDIQPGKNLSLASVRFRHALNSGTHTELEETVSYNWHEVNRYCKGLIARSQQRHAVLPRGSQYSGNELQRESFFASQRLRSRNMLSKNRFSMELSHVPMPKLSDVSLSTTLTR